MEQAWTWEGVNSQPLRALKGRFRDLTGVLIPRRGPKEGPKRGAGTAYGLWGKLGVPEEPVERSRCSLLPTWSNTGLSSGAPARAAVPTPHLLLLSPPRSSLRHAPISTAPESDGFFFFFFFIKNKTKIRDTG